MSTTVVPAHAGTHNHMRLLFEDWHFEFAKYDVLWLWVPALRSLCSLGRDDGEIRLHIPATRSHPGEHASHPRRRRAQGMPGA
jgi:hypothetical protein